MTAERDALIRTLLKIRFGDDEHVNMVMEGREHYPSFTDWAPVADGLLAAGYRLTATNADATCHPNCEQHGKSPTEGIRCDGSEDPALYPPHQTGDPQ